MIRLGWGEGAGPGGGGGVGGASQNRKSTDTLHNNYDMRQNNRDSVVHSAHFELYSTLCPFSGIVHYFQQGLQTLYIIIMTYTSCMRFLSSTIANCVRFRGIEGVRVRNERCSFQREGRGPSTK